MTEEEMNKAVAKMKYIETQMSSIQQQLTEFERALIDMSNARYALESLISLKGDTASLVPLGGGIFASGILKKRDKVSVEVGAGTIIEKTMAEAKEFLTSKEEEVKNNMTAIQNIGANLEKQYMELGREAQELSKK